MGISEYFTRFYNTERYKLQFSYFTLPPADIKQGSKLQTKIDAVGYLNPIYYPFIILTNTSTNFQPA